MAKTSKTSNTKAPKTSTKATKTSTKSKRVSKKSSKKVVKEVPVVVVESVPEPVVEAPVVVEAVITVEATEEKTEVETDPDQELVETFTCLIASQKTMSQAHREQMRMLKSLQSMVLKRIKTLKKRKTKRGGGNQKKNPSGFNKPTDISPELSTFLSTQIHQELLNEYQKMLSVNSTKNKDSLEKLKKFDLSAVEEKLTNSGKFARTEITSMIHMYIKGHNLQKIEDGRQFDLSKDSTLQALLAVPPDVVPTYFNLQSYLSKHFLKN